MKVFAQKIWSEPAADPVRGGDKSILYRRQEELMRSILGADAELVWGYNPTPTFTAATLGTQFFNNHGVLRSLLTAEEQGCDVALITCGNDPVLHEARDLLGIPVVSATESAVLTALALGRTYGVITLDDRSPAIIERNLAGAGLLSRAVRSRPIRSADLIEPITPWFTDSAYLFESVIPRFEEVAQQLIGDGADVIVAACGNFSAFAVHGYSRVTGTEVPVVDALSAGTAMAGQLGRLNRLQGLRTSKHSYYRGPSKNGSALLSSHLESFG